MRAKYTRQALLERSTHAGSVEDGADDLAFEDAEQVHYGLGRISLNHRDVLTLFFLQDLFVEEIAEVLEIAVGTVKSRLSYAKRALKAALEKEAGNYE